MAGLTLTGSCAPGLNVAAWRAARFQGTIAAGSSLQQAPRFPSVGQQVPANPDAGPVVAAPSTGAWALATATTEDFIVASYDTVARFWQVIAYHPPRLAPASKWGGLAIRP